jgi:hypothetical protein
MNRVLNRLRDMASRRTSHMSDEDFVIRGLWRVDHRCQPNSAERLLNYSFIMAQTEFQGCSYADFGSIDITSHAEALIGADARHVECFDPPVAIAVLDTVYAHLSEQADVTHQLVGKLSAKAEQRARIVVDEVMTLLEGVPRGQVAHVGVIGNFVAELRLRGVDLVATDYDPVLVRDGIHGVPVLHGDETPSIVEAADVALVCGETLIDGSLDEVLAAATRGRTKLLVYAVTGAHFAHEYCRTFSVDTVVAEPQPQYLFQGPTQLRVIRNR